VKRILRYLAGTINHGILIGKSSNSSLQGSYDANQGSNIDDENSTIRYYIYLGLNIVSRSSHKQKVTSRSNIEVAYHNIVATLAEIIWLPLFSLSFG